VADPQRPSDQADGDDTTQLDPPDVSQQFGKAAADDAETADRLLRDADGDVERAESAFADEARGPVPTETAHPRTSE
jgi:hypothetical protein